MEPTKLGQGCGQVGWVWMALANSDRFCLDSHSWWKELIFLSNWAQVSFKKATWLDETRSVCNPTSTPRSWFLEKTTRLRKLYFKRVVVHNHCLGQSLKSYFLYHFWCWSQSFSAHWKSSLTFEYYSKLKISTSPPQPPPITNFVFGFNGV